MQVEHFSRCKGAQECITFLVELAVLLQLCSAFPVPGTQSRSLHAYVDVATLTCTNSPLLYLEATKAKKQHRSSSEQLLSEVRDLKKSWLQRVLGRK